MLLRLLMRQRPGDRLNNVVQRLFYTKLGQTVLSILFGISLAFMFQKACNGKECITLQSPPLKEFADKVFKNGTKNECYRYTPEVVPCKDDTQLPEQHTK